MHHGVSGLDRALALGRSLAPDRVARLLTRILEG
ncbi:short chain dehydrogenase [Corynebacterium halotolerans YIM 70093 = DSM 44683]|uniref:Short chain dehydrogenase n=1 Tax=Corynebacterium halotolerans YIM 70093 = DSM 44683 TaxID=1121362 RepID=M1MTS1_9CORY|nr:short chain dehydrogenase [Corynebacterium halotolerans YIM 70093 = DSM 44683]